MSVILETYSIFSSTDLANEYVSKPRYTDVMSIETQVCSTKHMYIDWKKSLLVTATTVQILKHTIRYFSHIY